MPKPAPAPKPLHHRLADALEDHDLEHAGHALAELYTRWQDAARVLARRDLPQLLRLLDLVEGLAADASERA